MSILRANQINLSNTNSVRYNDTEKRFEVLVANFWIPMSPDFDFTNITNKTRLSFSGTGVNQTWTVPTGISYIFAKVWGAGGGGGRVSGWSYGAPGGGGGHSRGVIPVAAGETLTLVVGSGGVQIPGPVTSYGGGGGNFNTTDQTYGGQGGGMSGIFRSGVTQAGALIIAGGGGGGGSSRTWVGNSGGAGGGFEGQRGNSPYDGKILAGGAGGTQSGGGVAGAGYTNNGTAGAALLGGTSGTNSYGGGGGGGYWGGAGGSYSESNTMAGGGGGSGFISSSVLYGRTYTGKDEIPAMYQDPDLPKNLGTGVNANPAYGAPYGGNSNIAGGNGFIVIYY